MPAQKRFPARLLAAPDEFVAERAVAHAVLVDAPALHRARRPTCFAAAEVVKTQAVGFVQAATLRLQALHPLLDLLELLPRAR